MKAEIFSPGKNGNKNPVPYVYVEKGITYYEVKNGDYLLGLKPDSSTMTASVQRCDFVEGITSTVNGELDIPPNVGPYKIVKLEEGCFTENVKKDHSYVPDSSPDYPHQLCLGIW